MWKALLISVVAQVLALEAQAAAPYCGPRKEVVDQLAAKFGEKPVAIGISPSGELIEVLASEDGGTFSVIVTSSQRVSCVVLVGDSWQVRFPRSNPGA